MQLSETILNETSNFSSPPKSGIRLFAKRITQSQIYQRICVLFLVCNIIVLCLFSYKADENYLYALNYLHHSFSIIMILETIMKLLTLHFVLYMGDWWRIIEFVLSLLALLDLILDISYGWFTLYL